MVDYFDVNAANGTENAANGASGQPAAVGDANMDEISVSPPDILLM